MAEVKNISVIHAITGDTCHFLSDPVYALDKCPYVVIQDSVYKQIQDAVETDKTISASQQSYSSLIEHFSKIIAILSTEPTYVPNENPLKIATLNTQLTNLKNTNTAVINAYTTGSNSRISRDQSLYNSTNGLCETAKEVKMYVKSVFGATSQQYKQVSGIEFKSRKI